MEERKKRNKMREILVEWVSRVSVLFTKDAKKEKRNALNKLARRALVVRSGVDIGCDMIHIKV